MFPTEPIRRHCDVASPRPPKQGSNLRVTPVIVVLDEARDLGFEIFRQVTVLEQNAVLEPKQLRLS